MRLIFTHNERRTPPCREGNKILHAGRGKSFSFPAAISIFLARPRRDRDSATEVKEFWHEGKIGERKGQGRRQCREKNVEKRYEMEWKLLGDAECFGNCEAE